MTTLVGGADLREAVANQTFIKLGEAASVEAVKYDFHMGSRILKASYGQPMELSQIPPEKRFVDPGEAVFVLTKERLDLPNDMIATLTAKRKLAHAGILILGGFAIDPLYKGFLLVGLYNFSSTRFPLQEGKKLIGALFYRLNGDEAKMVETSPEVLEDFPEDLTRLIQSYKPVEINGVAESLTELRREFNNLRQEVSSDRTWMDAFRAPLIEHSQQIYKLFRSLEDEVESRRRSGERPEEKLTSMTTALTLWKSGWGILVGILLASLSAVLGYYVPKWFGR